MDIAIMGAGLSGLACAITLEKHGITPHIFEDRSRVGDRFVNGEVMLSMFIYPQIDCIAYFSEKHDIHLKPIAPLQKLELYSKNEKATLTGKLGFSNIRGRAEGSFESQLEQQLENSSILFNSPRSYEDLVRQYTHVVMAAGDGAYAKKTKNFREDLTVSIKGATVEGKFDRYAVMSWMNYDLTPYGVGYLIPFSDSQANLTIALPDIPKNLDIDMTQQWERFHSHVSSQLKQALPITDEFQITKYMMGICNHARIGNTFYTGNCYGALMPFMGFGQYSSILSGIYAAYDICGLGRYEDLMKPLRKSYENSLVLRKTLETLSNDTLDKVVRSLDGYLGDKIVSDLPIDPLKAASFLLRPYTKLKK
ncbi:NAD(P)-binding protein [Halobacillus sp. A5]|uniref:NAD(P)/FAD-dependent oxidoreductase n=1 Tax=Halobacillus sp. A5 TaxID=2880263 RepID=UPI0020A67E55|nr:NAD(P)/FAD-dependent oxidoreductase [Halobacillus sp. A5]